MSTIRKQSIISSFVVYFGFALGFFNTYLFTREGGFTKEQYGLTGAFIAIANIMFAIASLGMPAYVGKFFPYYKSHLQGKKSDQLAWALLLPCIGFLVVLLIGLAVKNILVDKIFNNSPQLLQYYYWLFPFGFGYTIFMVLEAYAWQQRRSVLSNLLKEVVFRLIITGLIVFTTLRFIKSFDVFIGIYAFTYLVLVLYLLFYFYRKGELKLTFTRSHVTKRFYKKIFLLVSFVWGGGLIFNFASVFDTIVIAAVIPNGLAAAGIFTLAQNISSLMQAPQRAIISAASGPLSQAWKEKNYSKIKTIYQRSSINQLIFAIVMFCLIWLNFDDAIGTFHFQKDYAAAKWAFFFIGLYKIIDMGTGLNAQIIATSSFWRFEFYSGLILLAFALPLNWQLTRYYGIEGPAISNLVAFTVYNTVRCIFLWRKFGMQPFTWKTIWALFLGAACYVFTWLLFRTEYGFTWMVLRSTFFLSLFLLGMFSLKLSPDVMPVLLTLKKKLRLG